MNKDIFIKLDNVSVQIPIFDATSRSIRNSFFYNPFEKNNNLKQELIIVEALKNISLSIYKGDRIGIMGKNGSGKTTFLRVCCGAMVPTEGKIKISGLVTPLIDISLGLEEDATGYENIILKGLYLKRSPSFSKKLFDKIEKKANLGNFLNLPIRTYSSGMKMRLAYAIATAHESEILILDEWISVGDSEWMERNAEDVNRFINSSDIFVFGSHDKDMIKKYCNRVLYIDNGIITEII